jgi:hypothetical protein
MSARLEPGATSVGVDVDVKSVDGSWMGLPAKMLTEGCFER